MPVGLEGELENGEEKTHTASSERGRKRVVLPPSFWKFELTREPFYYNNNNKNTIRMGERGLSLQDLESFH